MTKKIIKTKNAPAPPPSYSQGVVAAGLIFVSGQGPFDAASGEVIGNTIQEQTAQCLRNVQAILEAAGSSLAKVVSSTFILADEADFAGMNQEWGKWFAVDPPARQGAKLPIRSKGMKISVAVIAET
jgi:2-iminobutanoate/2-iminopropanoate deaminase